MQPQHDAFRQTTGDLARSARSEPIAEDENHIIETLDLDSYRATRDNNTWGRLIPPRLRHAHIDTLDSDAKRGVATEWQHQSDRNVVLVGPRGSGKTWLCVALARLAHDAGRRVAYWPVVELYEALREGREHLHSVCAAHVLILDDLAVDRPTPWTAERLFHLVNRRWLDTRPTLATANLSLERTANGMVGPLVEAVGERIASRLCDDAIIQQLLGRDRRTGT